MKNIGIGLLELMLALAVIAVMIVISVKYYTSANTEQEATSLVDSYNTIKSAVENYLADNPNATVPSLQVLIQNGYLPNLYGGLTQASGGTAKFTVNNNPWGGTITVAPQKGMFTIQQTNIPGVVCNMAYGQLQATLNTTLGESIVATATSSGSGTTGQKKAPNGCGAISSITVTYVQ